MNSDKVINVKALQDKLDELRRLENLKKDFESAIKYFSKVAESTVNPNNTIYTSGTIIGWSGSSNFTLSPISGNVKDLVRDEILTVLNNHLAIVNTQILELEI